MLNKRALLGVVFCFACVRGLSASVRPGDRQFFRHRFRQGRSCDLGGHGDGRLTGYRSFSRGENRRFGALPDSLAACGAVHDSSGGPGFQTTEQKDVRLQVDEHRELDFSLAPASVSTSVEVSGTAVAVETANPTLGQVITSEQVADLPLNGRNFVQLATLTPGTTSSTSPVSFFTSAASSEAATRGSFSLSSGRFARTGNRLAARWQRQQPTG